MEVALRQAAEFDGPIVVHVLTQKGRGYRPAEDDDEKCLHDAPVFDPAVGPQPGSAAPKGYTQAFNEAMLEHRRALPQRGGPHRRHARRRPGCCPSRTAGRTASSTSASPSKPQ